MTRGKEKKYFGVVQKVNHLIRRRSIILACQHFVFGNFDLNIIVIYSMINEQGTQMNLIV